MIDSWFKKHFKKIIIGFATSGIGITIMILMIVLILALTSIMNSQLAQKYSNTLNNSTGKLCDKVKSEFELYKFEIDKYDNLKKYDRYIYAQVCQESGGEGNDPMQVSEYYCGQIGCITDKNKSIEIGVKHLNDLLQKVIDSGLDENFETVLQTYNFGVGYLEFLKSKGAKKTTEELAIEFSTKMCGTAGTSIDTAVNDIKTACYGDYKYVAKVLKFMGGGKWKTNLFKSKPFLTQQFGRTKFSLTGIYGIPFHNGVDLTTGEGSEILAPISAEVIEASNQGAWGNTVVLKADNIYIRFAHLSSIKVLVGTNLSEGDLIGLEGNTGNSGGSHLHLSVYNGNYNVYSESNVLNPLDFINDEYTDSLGELGSLA